MALPLNICLPETWLFGRVAFTALVIGLGGAAIATLPLGNVAFADKGGNGNGHGGGAGGGKDHDGGGNGNGHGGGNGGGNGNSGGNGNGSGHGGGNDDGGQGNNGNAENHDGPGSSAKAGKSGNDDASPDDSSGDDSSTVDNDADDSMSSKHLGKLNGFFHAAPNALANASPNSSIGRISHTFKDALSDFAKANEDDDTTNDPNATPPSGPSVGDLGGILAGATNKKVTAAQVKAVIDRLAEANPDDESLHHFAGSVDESTCQDIADAANASKSGDDAEDSSDASDDSADTSNDGAGDDSAIMATTEN